jgi:hypothetical protein
MRPVASLVYCAGSLGHEAGGLRPSVASPAQNSLAYPHGEEEGSTLGLGIGLRLSQSPLSFPSLSFISKSIVFPSLLLSTFGMVGFLVVVLASSRGLVHSNCSQQVVVMR